MKNPILLNTPKPSRGLRGGYWNDGPLNLRSAWRDNFSPTFRFYAIGFRVFRTQEKQS